MRRRHLPRLWLVTDERQGDALLPAVRAMPRGSGVVFRHFRTAARADLLEQVRQVARRRGVRVLVAREAPGRWWAEGDDLRVAVVHDAGELRSVLGHRPVPSARAAGRLSAIFVSPVFATRTHPGAPTLGITGFARIAARSPLPVIALGGMDAGRFRRVRRFGAYGWAAIDGLTPGRDQKRKAVPR